MKLLLHASLPPQPVRSPWQLFSGVVGALVEQLLVEGQQCHYRWVEESLALIAL